ncbi:MAG: septal ring lytic transglycosylase RlpA family protein [Thermoanaerobaculia bacterium]
MTRFGRVALAVLAALAMHACVTARPRAEQPPERFSGMASWYGEEFAGRTTANGEIFDPLKLTAAHRTLPFGTMLDVTNPTTGKSVRVRINDRGPFVGDRVLDVSYAAAMELGMVDAGVARLEARIVSVGRGELEPPQPYVVTIEPPDEIIRAPEGPPPVAFPLPGGRDAAEQETAPATEDDVVEEVVVIEERAGEATRKQVGPDGVTIETVTESGRVVARETPRAATPAPRPSRTPPAPAGTFVVQLGAFQVADNAEALQKEVAALEPNVFVERRSGLWRVRVGPFPTRGDAVAASERLERAGFPGIVLGVD